MKLIKLKTKLMGKFQLGMEDVPTLYNYLTDGWLLKKSRNNHLGDLYYDNGQAYRFHFKTTIFWKPIADSDVQAIYEELNSKITKLLVKSI